MANTSIGMMDGAFFIGRKELLSWLNNLLKLDYTKIEECKTGAAYCQIVDACFPGKVALHQVKFDTKFEYEYTQNYKILQSAFQKLRVEFSADATKLMKGSYQDNLEFLQWMKRWYELNNQSEDEYDAVSRRKESGITVKSPTPQKNTPRTSTTKTKTTQKIVRRQTKPTPKKKTTSTTTPTSKTSKTNLNPSKNTKKIVKKITKTSGDTSQIDKEKELLEQQKEELSNLLEQSKEIAEGIEKERDFYFEKLKKIEELCLENQENETLSNILDVIYAGSDDEDEKEVVENEDDNDNDNDNDEQEQEQSDDSN
ncbi:microtubule-associated protein rp/eb family member [Anaeramoeba ignava]|uniref:Microtubule-associated protein rp/eb family member n=1 Tax=Anaeramoeba ignava TaxID=1746090 RepID=A0A9Q0LT75_ANAIG|nr:microtubule-associated protein rp/eb family member [Anaeramoeba ignava]